MLCSSDELRCDVRIYRFVSSSHSSEMAAGRGLSELNRTFLLRTEEPRSAGVPQTDFAALALLVFGGLELNHVLNQLTGIEDLLWPVVICLATILCLRYSRYALIGDVYLLFLAFVSSYLISATLTGLAKGTVDWLLLVSYAATLLFLSGLYFWFAGQSSAALRSSLNFYKYVLLAACIGILLSPYLGFGFGYAGERAAGLFEDPNQAAVAALYCLVLVVAYPASNRLLVAAQVGIALVALVLTLSKAGFLILLALVCMASIERRSIVSIGFALLALLTATWGADYVLESNTLGLPREYRERLGAISKILSSGEVSAETTTGRTLLWQFGLEKLEPQLPWGAGLGEFHHMEGGYRRPRHKEQWLGVHNFFLMVLGEGGLLPFLVLILFVGRLFATVNRTGERTVGTGFAIVLSGDLLSTHTLLGSRLSITSLAVLIALSARGEETASDRNADPALDQRGLRLD